MKSSNKTKKYLKINLLTFLVLFFLLHSTIFIQKVSADSEKTKAVALYNTAWKVVNEKFYFKSTIDLDSWQNKFENKINNLTDAHKYINKLIKALDDPYTRLLTKEEFKDELNIMNSKLIGIGVKLALNKPKIIEVLPDSPANKEGLVPDDYIISINGKSTKHLNPNQVANLLRGQENSLLTVKLKRGDEILTKVLKRKEVKLKVVSSKLLDNDVAIIKISSFIPESTSELFKNEVLKLMATRGLIIDLRNNSGGLMKNAVEIADMFLKEGKIVTTVSDSGRKNEFANSDQITSSHLIILVNESTASASEILAGALKENKRALVIGKKTYGKSLVQEILQLPDDSALHLTIAAYLTPSGRNINKVGIVPDEIVSDEGMQVERAKEILISLEKNTNNVIAGFWYNHCYDN
ncbi:MAG: S41 family peptidase [Candidatus Melainabacteria bacterium]|nr:S41 family peptidase [Candidatus Melainabacteria bacterium]